ncbi:MAG: CpaF family protein [Candidatus Norongarragalinales archaeon]
MRKIFVPYLEELLRESKEKKEKRVEREKEKEKTLVQPSVAVPLGVAQVVSEAQKKMLVEQYGDVRVWKVAGDSLLLYEVPTPHYRGEEKKLITDLMEIAIRVMPTEFPSDFSQEELRRQYFKRILEIIDSTPELRVPFSMKNFYANAVVREMIGYSLIDQLMQDDLLEEIMVIGQGKPVYVFHRKYDMMKTNIVFYDEKDIYDLIDRLARTVGRRVDTQMPLLDARLKDGTRVNASLPPATIDGPTITLRKFRRDPLSVIDLIKFGTLNLDVAAFLWLAVDGNGVLPANILVSGGTASGKTTSLNVLCSFIPNSERVITIEDTAELSLPLSHLIRCETRPPGIEGTGEITMNALLKNALRMRPDRIIVGEIRGEEGYTMFSAMNVGHRGSLGTVHANSAHETLIRLTNPPISVPTVMLTPLNFIVMQNRVHDLRKGTIRRITEIAELTTVDPDTGPKIQVLWSWDAAKDELYKTNVKSVYFQVLSKFSGFSEQQIADELEERKKVLQDLMAKGVRSLTEVCAVTQNYIEKKAGYSVSH